MRASPVDLIGGFYTSDSLPWACQETVNWLPVMAEVAGTRTVSMLETPPGLRPYQQIGTGPIRGMHDCEGLRLVVSGRYLFRISSAGVGVPIGIIPGVGRVSMTHNQFQTGYQVLVENGQAGGGYVYNTVDQSFGRITDEGYPGSISSDYVDSFMLGVEPFGRFWFHSNLADATDYNTLDRYEAEASPDNIVGLAVNQLEVVVFGQRTIEFFKNTGGATGTFQNMRAGIARGCASRDTIAKLDNTLFWLGDDGIVYRLNGYAPQPVSTRALDQAISGYNLSQAFAFTWEDRGHKVYYLSFPDGETFGYDVITGLWHRRESFGLNRWRLSHTVKWGGKWYGGDFQNGRIWIIDWDYHLEGADPIISERVSPVLHDDQSAIFIPHAEVVFDTGQGPGSVPEPFPPQPAQPHISGSAPNGVLGRAYKYTYAASGGDGDLRFQLFDQPSWMSINSVSGEVSFLPSAAGTFSYRVRVTDGNGMWDEINDAVAISRSIMAIATPTYTYSGIDGAIVSATPVNMSGTARPGGLSITPNGKFIAIATAASPRVQVREINADATAYLQGPELNPALNQTGWDAKFSNDGTLLAVATETSGNLGRIAVYDATVSPMVRLHQVDLPVVVPVIGWKEDGSCIAFGMQSASVGNNFGVIAYSKETGFGSPVYSSNYASKATPTCIRWRGDFVAAGSSTYANIWRWNAGSLQYRTQVGAINSSHYVEWMDGGIVVCGSSNGYGPRVKSYAFNGSSVVGPVVPDQEPSFTTISGVSLSNDGKLLAIGNLGASTSAIYIYQVNGLNLVPYGAQPTTPLTAATSIYWTSNGL